MMGHLSLSLFIVLTILFTFCFISPSVSSSFFLSVGFSIHAYLTNYVRFFRSFSFFLFLNFFLQSIFICQHLSFSFFFKFLSTIYIFPFACISLSLSFFHSFFSVSFCLSLCRFFVSELVEEFPTSPKLNMVLNCQCCL